MSSTLQKMSMPSNITQLLESILPSNTPSPQLLFTTSCAILATAIFTLFAVSGYFNSNKVLRKTPFLGSLSFFSTRHDFMDATLRIEQDRQRKQNQSSQRGGTYTFDIANFKVNVLHGEVGRKLFFGDKNLSLYQGYLFLRGGFPTTSKMGEAVETDNETLKKRLLYFVRKDYLAEMLPVMFKSITSELTSWNTSGRMEPFDKIYTYVFQLTSRLFVCTEISQNKELLARVRSLYYTIEDSANSVTNLLPWYITRQKLKAYKAMKELAGIVTGLVAARKREGRREDDPLQYLIDLQDSDTDIVQYVFKIIFAASINTGAITAWVLVFLSRHPDQMQAALNELTQAADATGFSGTLPERLTHVPLEAWEGDMPVFDRVIKETIRVVFAILALRRNINDTITIDGKKISKGEFLAYPIHDVHLNENIYPEAEKWNPDRWNEERKGSTTWPFLGWGVARFPCTGMRMAKLEIKTIAAMSIATFDLQAVDMAGTPMREDPRPNRNDWQRFSPQEPVGIKYRRR